TFVQDSSRSLLRTDPGFGTFGAVQSEGMMKARMLCAAAALACGLVPASAAADTLVGGGGTLTYPGQPGEQNTIEFQDSGGGFLYVGPTKGSVSGCSATGSPTLFACGGIGSIVADLGDGDDTVFASSHYPTSLSGGPGDDELVLV